MNFDHVTTELLLNLIMRRVLVGLMEGEQLCES